MVLISPLKKMIAMETTSGVKERALRKPPSHEQHLTDEDAQIFNPFLATLELHVVIHFLRENTKRGVDISKFCKLELVSVAMP